MKSLQVIVYYLVLLLLLLIIAFFHQVQNIIIIGQYKKWSFEIDKRTTQLEEIKR